MSELLQGQLEKILLAVLTSAMGGFTTCASAGCAGMPKLTAIGAVSEKPVFIFTGFGLDVKVHALEMTFENDKEETVPEP